LENKAKSEDNAVLENLLVKEAAELGSKINPDTGVTEDKTPTFFLSGADPFSCFLSPKKSFGLNRLRSTVSCPARRNWTVFLISHTFLILSW